MKKVKVSFVDGREEYFDIDRDTNYSDDMFWYSKDDDMFCIKRAARDKVLLPREFVRYICIAD